MKKIWPSDSRYVPLTQQPWCCVPTCIQMVMLRHGIPLVPAEVIGYHMGLVVPEKAKHLFWSPRLGERPPAGWGTQAGKPQYGPNAVFKKLGIPLKMSWALINKFKTIDSFKAYLAETQKADLDVLVCFDWPTLLGPQRTEHWGHVCVLDTVNLKSDMVRLIDPDPDARKWREVSIADLYNAMVFHGKEKSGGFWELHFTDIR